MPRIPRGMRQRAVYRKGDQLPQEVSVGGKTYVLTKPQQRSIPRPSKPRARPKTGKQPVPKIQPAPIEPPEQIAEPVTLVSARPAVIDYERYMSLTKEDIDKIHAQSNAIVLTGDKVLAQGDSSKTVYSDRGSLVASLTTGAGWDGKYWVSLSILRPDTKAKEVEVHFTKKTDADVLFQRAETKVKSGELNDASDLIKQGWRSEHPYKGLEVKKLENASEYSAALARALEAWQVGDRVYVIRTSGVTYGNQDQQPFYYYVYEFDNVADSGSLGVGYENAKARLGEMIADHTEKKTDAKPFREELEVRQAFQARQKRVADRIRTDPVAQEFARRFKYDKKLDDNDVNPEDGLLLDSGRSIALIMNEKYAEGKLDEHPISVRINPTIRKNVKFDRNSDDWDSRFAIFGDAFFNRDDIYNALMVLDTSAGPIKFHKKSFPLIIEDAKGNKIAIAPEIDRELGRAVNRIPFLGDMLGFTPKHTKKEVIERNIEKSKAEVLKEADAIRKKERPSYHKSEDDWLNSELTHRAVTESYLHWKEALVELQTGKEDVHDEVWKEYHDRKVWENGHLLI